MNNNFEFDLPDGYKEAYHIDATNKKFGIIFNLVALVILVIVMAISLICLGDKKENIDIYNSNNLLALIIFMVLLTLYIILHELVHGIAYKALTKQKLTFGMSWSCVFCGVPNIYTYRKVSLIALLSPFSVFTILLVPVMIILFNINAYYFLLSSFIFGIHFGGCSGDLYMTFLLLFKFKDKETLIKDSGPEQWIYIKE